MKALSVAAGMFIALLAGAPSAIVAAAGAAALLLTRRVKPERVYRQIDAPCTLRRLTRPPILCA